MENDSKLAAQALSTIIDVLSQLDNESRIRVLKSVSTFFHVPADLDPAPVLNRTNLGPSTSSLHLSRPSFSEAASPTPKQFLFEKQPQTDVERIACLAYYLTHFRNVPHFRTLDLAKLNTEAAHPKFSNTAYAANNAASSGYLAAASKNQRQISAAGEQFVMALPDRDAAKAVMARARKKILLRRKKAE